MHRTQFKFEWIVQYSNYIRSILYSYDPIGHFVLYIYMIIPIYIYITCTPSSWGSQHIHRGRLEPLSLQMLNKGVAPPWQLGTPIAGWFISWKIPIYRWMMTGGSPILGNHQINDERRRWLSYGFAMIWVISCLELQWFGPEERFVQVLWVSALGCVAWSQPGHVTVQEPGMNVIEMSQLSIHSTSFFQQIGSPHQSGWCFGCHFLFFHILGCIHHPNWLYRGVPTVQTTKQEWFLELEPWYPMAFTAGAVKNGHASGSTALIRKLAIENATNFCRTILPHLRNKNSYARPRWARLHHNCGFFVGCLFLEFPCVPVKMASGYPIIEMEVS